MLTLAALLATSDFEMWPDFAGWFASQDVVASAAPVYTVVIPSPMTGTELVASLNMQPLTLGQIVANAHLISKTSKHLFLVADTTAVLRVVMAFRINGRWRFIARPTTDTDAWYSDVHYGALMVHSSSPLA